MFDIFFTLLKRSLVFTMTLVFAFVITYVPQPTKNAEAFILPTFDAKNALVNTKTSIESTATTVSVGSSAIADAAIVAKEYGLDGIAKAIAQAIVSSMVASLVDWINSGFQGSPAFITDLEGFLLETLDKKAFQIIEELGGDGSFLCSPFRLNIQIALAIQYDNTRVNRPYRGCSVSNFIGGFEEFLSGVQNDNFLRNWVTLTSNPQKYTPYGQYIEGRTAVRRGLADAKERAATENSWGSGYQSGKICEQVESASSRSSISNPELTNVTAAGLEGAGLAAPIGPTINTTPNPLAPNPSALPQTDVVINTTPNPLAPNPNLLPTDGIIAPINSSPTAASGGVNRAVSDVSRTLSGLSRTLSGANLRCSISKPGRLIADRISKSLGLSDDSLITADEINEIVTALIAQLATKAITGASGLLGLSSGTGYTYSNFADGYTARAAAEAAGAAQDAAARNTSNAADLVREMQGALQVQEDFAALAEQQIPILRTFLQNPLLDDEQLDRATVALEHAGEVRVAVPGLIPNLIPLINRAQALQLEYDRADTSLERKAIIIQELIEVDTQFNRLGLYRQGELDYARREWDPSRY